MLNLRSTRMPFVAALVAAAALAGGCASGPDVRGDYDRAVDFGKYKTYNFLSTASGNPAEFDAVVCMYQDQGLIPLKLLHFDDAINVTLGLPIIRTSVDHGTAYDIAGQGKGAGIDQRIDRIERRSKAPARHRVAVQRQARRCFGHCRRCWQGAYRQADADV